MERFYITTAIDYPNSVPHMGHAYEKAVADFYARWYRLRGATTFFLTGLDEHGQKIQEAADAAGVSPQVFVDEKSGAFTALCERLEVSNDDFVRTSEPRHHRFAVDMYRRVKDAGDIYFGQYEGQYCVSCETFYTDSQLVDGACPIHERPTERVTEPSYFFRLGKYREWIRDHIRDRPEFVFPDSRRNEILARLDDEVRDLSISRSTFKWGIPLPDDPDHVLYVWFDALSNYISALREPVDRMEQFWPADMHVIGKDIIWFHSVIWPCMLHSAGLPLPRQVYVHGFVLDHEGRKMAKHLGNVVDPLDMITRYGADVLRYYLLRAISSGQDGKFSEAEIVERYNNELGNDLGNLVMRVAKLVDGRCGGTLDGSDGPPADLDAAPVVDEFARHVDAREHQRAVEALWAFVRRTNAYLNERAPWSEKDDARCRAVLYNALEALRAITYLLAPVMPRTAEAIADQIGSSLSTGALAPFGSGSFRVRRADPLFPRIDTARERATAGADADRSARKKSGKKKEREKKPPAPAVEPFAKLDIRVGLIEEVKEHPDADALWVLRVALGESDDDRRTICAGLRQHLAASELEGRRVVVLANLKPAKLRGIESRGMILATDRKDGKVVPVDPGDAPLGDQARVEGVDPAPKAKLSTKGFDRAPLTIQGGQVVSEGRPLKTSAGPLTCDAEDGAKVR